jgi:hypothetical protein
VARVVEAEHLDSGVRSLLEPGRTATPLIAQWTSPDTIDADEPFWRNVLDPRDRALDRALAGSRD